MGIDIHVAIVKDGKFITPEIELGRNYDWFTRIREELDEYDFMKWHYDVNADYIPEEITHLIKEDCGCFGFKCVTVKDFLNWYATYQPNLTAGWVRKKIAWMWEKKGVPIYLDEIYDTLEPDANMADWEFVETENTADESSIIMGEIPLNVINDENAYIVFYFDC